MQKKVNFIVTDLDDTIWDWLSMWHGSFNPYLERISQELNINKAELKNDFKQLHQKYGTTEASFIIEELKLLNAEQREKIHAEVSDRKGIMHEYYSNKKNGVKLYDGVLKTLTDIKNKGAMIVGFTESHSFYTKYRLKILNLDGLLDCIYAPVDAGLPDSVKRYYNESHWEPEKTEFRYLSRSVKKPNSEILEIILKDFNAKKEDTIYIGDKLDRDVYMAQQAGITSVYAEYGHKIVGAEYDLLREVTHWTQEDVDREIKFKTDFAGKTVSSDVVLKNSFKEIEDSFIFYPFERPDKKENIREDKKDRVKNVIDVWKKVVDVQQHFNDIELRIRNYALTLFTATAAGIGLLERDKIEFVFWGWVVPASAILSLVGLLVLCAFWYMDRLWYHKLLQGAVNQGRFIEDKYADELPEIGLTNAIGKESPHTFLWFKKKVRSNNKYWFFYLLLAAPLLALCVILFAGHLKKLDKNKPKMEQQTTNQAIDTTISSQPIKIIVPDTTEDKEFAKGFNDGYLLGKHQPDLFNKLEKSLEQANTSYAVGLINGKQEYEI